MAENRVRFYRAAALDPARVVRMHQVHGARVVTAGSRETSGRPTV